MTDEEKLAAEMVLVNPEDLKRTREFAMTFDHPRTAALCLAHVAFVLADIYSSLDSFDQTLAGIREQVRLSGERIKNQATGGGRAQ